MAKWGKVIVEQELKPEVDPWKHKKEEEQNLFTELLSGLNTHALACSHKCVYTYTTNKQKFKEYF